MSVLIIAEHDNKQLKPSTLNAITAACALDKEIHLLVAGHRCETVSSEAAQIAGVTQVLHIDNIVYEHPLAENLSLLVETLVRKSEGRTRGSAPTVIMAPATTFGKDLIPRTAALLDVAAVSDVIKIIDPTTFVRPVYAGNAHITVQSQDPVQVLTIRTTAFEPAEKGATIAPIQPLDLVFEAHKTHFIEQKLTTSSRPELTSARIVVSGGRGLQNADNFTLIERLADKLGAAVGASRAAVDAGFVPNDFQVGQTGKVVAPELYIAIGISGAIQHLAGMKDSKVIVAINKDEDAPMIKVADYAWVTDLFAAIPALEQALEQLK